MSVAKTHLRAFLPIVLVTAVGLAIFLWTYLDLWSFLIDDTFISLRYAENLASGHGLVYNVGERVEGYTNFLWTVIFSIPFVARLDPLIFIKVVNLILVAAAAVVLYLLGHTIFFRQQPWVAFVPPLLFLAAPATALSAAEGLETMLFAFLSLLSFLLLFREDGHSFPWSAVGFSLVAITRPDGVLFAGLATVFIIAQKLPRDYLARFLATFTILFGGYFVGRAAYYQDLLPNTFYAKGGGERELVLRGLQDVLTFVRQYGGIVVLVSLLGLRNGIIRPYVVVLLAAVTLRMLFNVWSGAAWMGHFRFLVPVLPIMLLLAVAGIVELIQNWKLQLLGIVTVGLFILIPAWRAYPYWHQLYQEYARGLSRAHIALGKEINTTSARSIVMAMDDAGAGPFYAKRTNIDMLGLNDRHIAHLPGRFYGKFDSQYVLDRHPDLIVLLSYTPQPSHPDDFRVPGHADLYTTAAFQKFYDYWKTFQFADDYFLVVYRLNNANNVSMWKGSMLRETDQMQSVVPKVS